MTDHKNNNGTRTNTIWIGVGIGAAIGVAALAISQRKRDRWYSAKQVSRRVADHTGELAAASKDIIERIRLIYNESCKVVDEATELLSHGRKLVGA